MTADAEPYHWPPELLRSLIDVIPLICRSKNDVVTFLRSAGAHEEVSFRQACVTPAPTPG